MPHTNIVIDAEISESIRCRQVESIFDVPPGQAQRLEWDLDVPILEDDGDFKPWQVGLIVGPSGAGKSTVARHLFGENFDRKLRWAKASVFDDFPNRFTVEQISQVCQAVGFNTIPAWLRPHKVLSNGEKFRVEVARRLLDNKGLVVMDEFTSVVDRQVAKIAAHAVQKYTRRQEQLQFVGVTCHYDVIDWLQPDWVLEPHERKFVWRSLCRRPTLKVTVSPIDYSAWQLFAPFHYLTAELNKSARCFCLFVDDEPVSFLAVLHKPHAHVKNLKGGSRLVTLPDWQGLGLAFCLLDTVSSTYSALGYRMRCYPAHPPFIRSYARSKSWRCIVLPGKRLRPQGASGSIKNLVKQRPCAVFEYVGEKLDVESARTLMPTLAAPKV